MHRRDFVNKAKILSLGTFLVPPILTSCEKELSSSFLPDEKPKGYVPSVNNPPYFERDYYFQKENKANPVFSFGEAYKVYFQNKNHDLVNGLESTFYGDKISNKKFISVFDPQKKYLPNLNSLDSKKGLSYITMLEKEEGDIGNGGIGSEAYGLFIKQIKDGLPSFDSEQMCEKPGMVYLGDWSFNNLKQLNTNLNKASSLVTIVAPNIASAAVFAATAKVGVVLEKIDFFIDMINRWTSLEIDKNNQHSIYQFPFDQSTMIVSLGQYYSCSQKKGDINELFPLNPDNSWTYKDNFGGVAKWAVKGMKKIGGKDLLFTQNVDGTEEYFGFNGTKLGQYGMKDPGIGNIFFSPPIILGDDQIEIGKNYTSSSKIICENYPEITGTAKENILYQKRESLVLPNSKPYGDCFKMKEDFSISVTGNGQTSSVESSFFHWYSKNVGKVKIEGEGIEANLIDSDINLKSKNAESNFNFPFSKKIVQEIKKLI